MKNKISVPSIVVALTLLGGCFDANKQAYTTVWFLMVGAFAIAGIAALAGIFGENGGAIVVCVLAAVIGFILLA